MQAFLYTSILLHLPLVNCSFSHYFIVFISPLIHKYQKKKTFQGQKGEIAESIHTIILGHLLLKATQTSNVFKYQV